MPKTVKSDAQRQHEARNKALRLEANKRRREQKAAGKAAFAANKVAMREKGEAIRAARQQAHIDRNNAAAAAAAEKRAEAAATASNDNSSKGGSVGNAA